MDGKGSKMMEWQPIETAPKDGSRILVTGERWDDNPQWIVIAEWSRKGFRAENCDFPSWGDKPPKNCYRDYDADHYLTPMLIGLTHWMPLPPPP